MGVAAQSTFDPDMVVDLDLGPGGISAYLQLIGERRNPLIKYHQGSLTLVSPSHAHERFAERLDGLVKAICAGLDLDYHATASTLFRRNDLDSGIEADKTYYLTHEPAVRGVTGNIDLSIYPPPELAVEVVVSHSAAKSLAICQELGVSEVWIYSARKRVLEFLCLDDQGIYRASAVSRAFPFLAVADVPPWLEGTEGESDHRWERRLRDWVVSELAPRRPSC
jgi:Uma2 family endonuclease